MHKGLFIFIYLLATCFAFAQERPAVSVTVDTSNQATRSQRLAADLRRVLSASENIDLVTESGDFTVYVNTINIEWFRQYFEIVTEERESGNVPFSILLRLEREEDFQAVVPFIAKSIEATVLDVPMGRITIESTEKAQLYVDDQFVSWTPVIEASIPAGRRRIRLEGDRIECPEQIVEIRAGKTLRADLAVRSQKLGYLGITGGFVMAGQYTDFIVELYGDLAVGTSLSLGASFMLTYASISTFIDRPLDIESTKLEQERQLYGPAFRISWIPIGILFSPFLRMKIGAAFSVSEDRQRWIGLSAVELGFMMNRPGGMNGEVALGFVIMTPDERINYTFSVWKGLEREITSVWSYGLYLNFAAGIGL